MSKTSSSQEISDTTFEGLSVKEAAYLLKVSPKTIYGWCDAGKIDFFRIGGESGSIRIKKDHLGQLIHSNLSYL